MTWNAVIALLLLRHDPAGGVETPGDFIRASNRNRLNCNLSNPGAFVACSLN
jgi:hypothetical protein